MQKNRKEKNSLFYKDDVNYYSENDEKENCLENV